MTKLLIQVYDNLPSNQKEQEVHLMCRQLIGTLFSDAEYEKFKKDIREAIDELNAKYPRTKPYRVHVWSDVSNTPHIGINLDGTDKSLSLIFCEVKRSYTIANEGGGTC